MFLFSLSVSKLVVIFSDMDIVSEIEGMPSTFVVMFSTTYCAFFIHRSALTFMYPR